MSRKNSFDDFDEWQDAFRTRDHWQEQKQRRRHDYDHQRVVRKERAQKRNRRSNYRELWEVE